MGSRRLRLARKKGKGVWCPSCWMRWAVGNASRQAHPAGAKGFPTKPFHSRDARQKVQGVKHGQGSLNISQRVCKESQISGVVMKVARSKEGVKGTFGTA